MSENKIPDYEFLYEEKSTGLKISRFEVPTGWIYLFAYPLGLETQFVPNVLNCEVKVRLRKRMNKYV